MKDKDIKIIEVGWGFVPSPKMDETLGEMLGGLVGDFCSDDALCLEHLEKHCVGAMVLPTLIGDSRLVFTFRDDLYVTIPFESDATACAAALLFVLESSKSPLT